MASYHQSPGLIILRTFYVSFILVSMLGEQMAVLKDDLLGHLMGSVEYRLDFGSGHDSGVAGLRSASGSMLNLELLSLPPPPCPTHTVSKSEKLTDLLTSAEIIPGESVPREEVRAG